MTIKRKMIAGINAFSFLLALSTHSLETIKHQTNQISMKSETSNDQVLVDLLTKRYSGRSYDSTRTISQQQIKELVESAHLAPSSYNEQPWRFIICDRTTDPEAYDKAFDALVEFNQGWAKNAPVLIVVVAASRSTHNNKFNRWAEYDSGAAAFSMMLRAASMGLMSHQMGGFDENKIQRNFSIPEGFVPMSVMAVGYATPNETASKKDRKPIKENFFQGAWDKGY